MAPFRLGKPNDPGRIGLDGCEFLEAVLWIVRTGAPWRDLPNEFGKWNSVYWRFAERRDKGVFVRMFDALSAADVDLEDALLDASIVHIHRHGQGARAGPPVRRSDAQKLA